MSRAIVFGTLCPTRATSASARRFSPIAEALRSRQQRPSSISARCASSCRHLPGRPTQGARLLRRRWRYPARGAAARLRDHCLRPQPRRPPHREVRSRVPAALRPVRRMGRNPLADDFVHGRAGFVDDAPSRISRRSSPVDAKDGKRPALYFWCRTMTCPDPAWPCRDSVGYQSLARELVAAARPGLSLARQPAQSRPYRSYQGQPQDAVSRSDGTVKARSVTCPCLCGSLEGCDRRP